jgi:anthranilate synthase/aminodeoxychorismate synthase-like glutamine amidotransferase
LVSLNVEVTVWEDKQVRLDDIEQFDCIVLSPGPGLPMEKESLFKVLEKYSGSKKILGVCLGMQGIAEFYGAKLYNSQEIKHGASEIIKVKTPGKLFKDLPDKMKVGLYNSWAVQLNEKSKLIPTAYLENGTLMAFEHSELPLFGVQFHPESILSDFGHELFKNFLFTT